MFMFMFMFRFRFRRLYSVLLLSYSITTGVLGSPDLLLQYPTTTLALHNTIILIITLNLSDQPYP